MDPVWSPGQEAWGDYEPVGGLCIYVFLCFCVYSYVALCVYLCVSGWLCMFICACLYVYMSALCLCHSGRCVCLLTVSGSGFVCLPVSVYSGGSITCGDP